MGELRLAIRFGGRHRGVWPTGVQIVSCAMQRQFHLAALAACVLATCASANMIRIFAPAASQSFHPHHSARPNPSVAPAEGSNQDLVHSIRVVDSVRQLAARIAGWLLHTERAFERAKEEAQGKRDRNEADACEALQDVDSSNNMHSSDDLLRAMALARNQPDEHFALEQPKEHVNNGSERNEGVTCEAPQDAHAFSSINGPDDLLRAMALARKQQDQLLKALQTLGQHDESEGIVHDWQSSPAEPGDVAELQSLRAMLNELQEKQKLLTLRVQGLKSNIEISQKPPRSCSYTRQDPLPRRRAAPIERAAAPV